MQASLTYIITQAATPTPVPAATATPQPTAAPVPTVTPAPTPVQTIGPNVVISCIFYDGTVNRYEPDEYVEITNLGDAVQDLAGWKLQDISDTTPVFEFPSHQLAPGDVVRIYTNEVHSQWGGFSFGRGSAVWSNSDPDSAGMFDSNGTQVSSRSYPPGCE